MGTAIDKALRDLVTELTHAVAESAGRLVERVPVTEIEIDDALKTEAFKLLADIVGNGSAPRHGSYNCNHCGSSTVRHFSHCTFQRSLDLHAKINSREREYKARLLERAKAQIAGTPQWPAWPVVHVLHDGSPLCGAHIGKLPCDWPNNERWVSRHGIKNATCAQCIVRYVQLEGG